MADFRTTKIFSLFDAVLQCLLFSGYLGIFTWNHFHQEKKVFTEYGELALYAGLSSTLVSFALDIFLLFFVLWKLKMAIFWWSYLYSGFTLIFWAFHLVVIYIGNGSPTFPYLSLGVWAFVLLYSRIALVMLVRADYLQLHNSKTIISTGEKHDPGTKSEDAQVVLPTTSNIDLVATTTPVYSLLNSQSITCSPSTPIYTLSPRRLDFEDAEESNTQDHTTSSTLCAFLGPQADIDHYYISRNEPILHAYNETEDFVGELPTVM